MAQTGSWRLKGVDRKTRRLAREAAAHSGLTTGAWIDRTIKAHGGTMPRANAEPLVTEFLKSARDTGEPTSEPYLPEKPRQPAAPTKPPAVHPAVAAAGGKPSSGLGRGMIGAALGLILLVGGYLFVSQLPTGTSKISAGADKGVTSPSAAESDTSVASRTAEEPEPTGPLTPMQRLAASARSGDARAQHDLGLIYVQGNGVPKDPKRGAILLEQSAATGLPKAQYHLGVLYEKGLGVTQNLSTAFQWYQRAAAQGHVRAQHNLGTLYAEGKGTAKNYAEAARWFSRASKGGLAESHYSLGMIHELGLGVEKDERKAAAFYRSALAAGSAQAVAKLAQMEPAMQERSRQADETLTASVPPGDDSAAATNVKGRMLSPEGIINLQRLLARLDLAPGPPDGVLGAQTVEAIKLYQRFAGLPVDGKPSLELLRDLRQVVGAMAADKPDSVQSPATSP